MMSFRVLDLTPDKLNLLCKCQTSSICTSILTGLSCIYFACFIFQPFYLIFLIDPIIWLVSQLGWIPQMCFNAFHKAADLDVLDHPVLNFIYYLVSSQINFECSTYLCLVDIDADAGDLIVYFYIMLELLNPAMLNNGLIKWKPCV